MSSSSYSPIAAGKGSLGTYLNTSTKGLNVVAAAGTSLAALAMSGSTSHQFTPGQAAINLRTPYFTTRLKHSTCPFARGFIVEMGRCLTPSDTKYS
jgi:hypothetical protein